MNIKYKPLITVMLVILLLSSSVYVFRDSLAESPFKSSFEFNTISRVAADTKNNLYVISDARQQISKVDPTGLCLYQIKIEDSAPGLISLFTDVAVDTQGRLYVLRTDLDAHAIYVVGESILRYTAKGKLDQNLYNIQYKGSERPLRLGRIKNLQIKSDNFSFIYVSGEQLWLKNLPAGQDQISSQLVATLPPETYLAEIVGTLPDELFYSTDRGEIYWLGQDTAPVPIYPPENTDNNDRSFPSHIRLGADNNLYFVDSLKNQVTGLIFGERTIQRKLLFPVGDLSKHNLDQPLKSLKDVTLMGSGKMVVAVADRLIIVEPGSKIGKVYAGADYKGSHTAFNMTIWCLLLIIIGLLAYAIKMVYVDLLDRKVSLIIKQVAIFVPVIIAFMVILLFMVYNNFSDRQERDTYTKLTQLTRIGQNMIDVQHLQNITSPRDYMNTDYKALRKATIEAQMNMYRHGSQIYGGDYRTDDYGLYSAMYKLENGKLYAIMDFDNSVNMYKPIDIQYEFNDVLQNRSIITSTNTDENGTWMFAMGPLYDAHNNIVGIYETGVDRTAFTENKNILFRSVATGIAVMTLVVVLILLITTYLLLASLRKLSTSVDEMAAGNWEVQVAINTRDEVADLGQRFNVMAEHIKNYVNEITSLSKSYYRFVPEEFLKFLGKRSVTEIGLGDQVTCEMSVLFSDIRSFTTISEAMTPEENFNFINTYLGVMGPVIRENGGFIDKYIGDAIMGLFPGDPSNSLHAALKMVKALKAFNLRRIPLKEKPINIGIGIHAGNLMLGVVGEKERIDGTVISDAVNLASRLESLTKHFGASIIVSEVTLNKASSLPNCERRFLGRVRVKGKNQWVPIYELFEASGDETDKAKLENRHAFEAAVNSFIKGDVTTAHKMFKEMSHTSPHDKAILLYLDKCDKMKKGEHPEHWDGTFDFDEK
ncbi:MAG: adenylate/guanylate cyclase domain-containing protein [Acidobacteriota bacterium]